MALTPTAPARGDAPEVPANGAYGTDAALLRDRVTAAIGDLYLVGREVGRGGMAVVYAAEDVRLQRPVALKVLPPELAFRADVRERFVREAQMAARLNHPHIVPIYAVHETGGIVCFAMALVQGDSLASRILREPRLPFPFVARMLEQMADALAYAHASGVVHRDIKPDNVLIDRESGRAMVTDFGIARAAEGGSRLTQTGIAVGTPAFMSPEQAMGDREVDGRSDIYAVGVVGYLMLAGKLPFEATSTPAMLMKHVSETPPPLRAARPDAPRALVEILERCLAKRPLDRWDSALALRDALRHVQRDGSLGGAAAPAPIAARAPQMPPLASASPPPVPLRDGGDGAPLPAFERQRDEAERFGHRSEDWAPRRVTEPAPAPRQRPASGVLPPIPQLPPLPDGADRTMQREWKKANKEAIKDWRQAVREQRRTMQADWQAQQGTAARPGIVRRVARRILRVGGGVATPSTEPMAPARVASLVHGFRRHLKWLAGSAGLAMTSFALGTATGADPLIIPFVGGLLAGMVSGQLSLLDWLRLRRRGISVGDALSDRWQQIAATSDTRPHEVKVAERLVRLAGDALLASRHGDTLRNAVDDRLMIHDIAAQLPAADRTMIPDVEPTAEALLERIAGLVTALERLDRDLPGDALVQLETRIAAVEAEPAQAPDRDRRLSLLTRQRASLEELAARRDTMQRQLDSATLALRSLRLDIVRLRTMGVGAALTDVTSATQEARALSRDLGYVLEAAEETRRL